MCIRWVRRVESYGQSYESGRPDWYTLCPQSRNNIPCSNQKTRVIRGSNSSFSSNTPGLTSHDASSTASSMPGTPTSGPRFDTREPFKNQTAANPLRYGSHLNLPSMGTRPSRSAGGGGHPVVSQPDPPNHRRVYSDSEYDARGAASSGSERATEIIDRDAAREAARREQRRKRLDEMRRQDEEENREERETALDDYEKRTQQRLSWREQLREDNRRKQQLEDERRERELRAVKTEREREEERQREADNERLEKLRREIAIEKEHDRRRQEQEEQDAEFKGELDALLEEERTRKARKDQLERELLYYQNLESRLDQGERRRAQQEAAERQMYDIAYARQADETRRAENSRQKRDRESQLQQEMQRLQSLERRLEDVRQHRRPAPSALPIRQQQQPSLPLRPGYGQIPPPPSRPYLTQSSQAPVLDDLLRTRPETILDTNVRRTHGENVLDRARQKAEERRDVEYRVPSSSGLSRRNTIGSAERSREKQYRNITRGRR